MATTTEQITVVHPGRPCARGWVRDHHTIPARPEIGTEVTVVSRYGTPLAHVVWRVVESPWHFRRVTAFNEPAVYEPVDPNPHGLDRYQDSFRLRGFDPVTGEGREEHLDVGTWVGAPWRS